LNFGAEGEIWPVRCGCTTWRGWLWVASLIAITVGVSGCVKTISPARTFDAYEHKAKDTAESVLSAVQTARLGARVGTDGDAFGPYVSVLLSEAEEAASGAHATFDSVQPPDAHADRLRRQLGTLLTKSDDHLSALRIAARRGELGRLSRLAMPLRPLARQLDRFISRHE
jgi:hypothetical protein